MLFDKSYEEVQNILEAIREDVQKLRIQVNEQILSFTVSIGVVKKNQVILLMSVLIKLINSYTMRKS